MFLKNFPTKELAWYTWDNEKVKSLFDIRKIQSGGFRYYFTYSNRWGPKFYMSVTTFCKKALPTSEHLINWKVELGAEQAQFLADMAAHYGTFMHDILLEYVVKRNVTVDHIDEQMDKYIKKEHLSPSIKGEWHRKIQEDLVAWTQWMQDYKFEPLVIEYPIIGYKKFMLGGKIDLIGRITVINKEKGYWGEVYKSQPKDPSKKKGDPKETYKDVEYTYNVMVDLKSGRKQFYESNEMQLICYQDMWNHHFGSELKVEKIFNWRPTEWRSADGNKYNFKDQTDSLYRGVYKDYYKIMEKLGKLNVSKTFKNITTKEMNADVPVSDQFSVMGPTEHIRYGIRKETEAKKKLRRKYNR